MTRRNDYQSPSSDGARKSLGRVGFSEASKVEAMIHENDLELAKMKADLIDRLTTHGGGSFLRGWRCYMDPDGDLKVEFRPFCEASVRIGFGGDVHRLFGGDKAMMSSLSLTEVAPKQGALLDRFRRWVSKQFGSPADMFEKLQESPEVPKVTRDHFLLAISNLGFEASSKDLIEVFECCDVGRNNGLSLDEVLFLELDDEVRQQERLKNRMKSVQEWRQHVTSSYVKECAMAPTNRLAARPWQSPLFETVPQVMSMRRQGYSMEVNRRQRHALKVFARFIQRSFGHKVRALRRGLATEGAPYSFDLKMLGHMCSRCGVQVDTRCLFRALDADGDGCVSLEELCPRRGQVLARFRAWAMEGPQAELIFRKENSDAPLPADWRLATHEEVKRNLDEVKEKLGHWDACMLANGWKVDGPDHGCNITKHRRDEVLVDAIFVKAKLIFQKESSHAQLPANWRLATHDEVKRNLDEVREKLGPWEVCMLADNWKVDGWAHGCNVMKQWRDDRLEHAIFVKVNSCSALWDLKEAVEKRRLCPKAKWTGNSQRTMTITAFRDTLKDIGAPVVSDKEARALLLTSLDLQGCGFITRADLEWLDGWEAPKWLCASPNRQAWEDLRAELMSRFDNVLLKAWRELMDVDNSNRLSWPEFCDACEKIGFHGDFAGAWCYLDDDLSGFISMREFDGESAALLESFKEWAEQNFGSVALCWKVIDADKSGMVTFPELQRACTKLLWSGNVRNLFDSLKGTGTDALTGKRSLLLEEVQFLDSWMIRQDLTGIDEEESAGAAEAAALAERRQTRRTLPPPPPCSRALTRGLTRSLPAGRRAGASLAAALRHGASADDGREEASPSAGSAQQETSGRFSEFAARAHRRRSLPELPLAAAASASGGDPACGSSHSPSPDRGGPPAGAGGSPGLARRATTPALGGSPSPAGASPPQSGRGGARSVPELPGRGSGRSAAAPPAASPPPGDRPRTAPPARAAPACDRLAAELLAGAAPRAASPIAEPSPPQDDAAEKERKLNLAYLRRPARRRRTGGGCGRGPIGCGAPAALAEAPAEPDPGAPGSCQQATGGAEAPAAGAAEPATHPAAPRPRPRSAACRGVRVHHRFPTTAPAASSMVFKQVLPLSVTCERVLPLSGG